MKKMVQKHQTFMTELVGHEPRVSDTIERCEKLISAQTSPTHGGDLTQALGRLKMNWEGLKRASEKRGVELEDALNVANYYAEASEAENWMREKEQLVSGSDDLAGGRGDEDSTEASLKRHSANMIDIEAFGQNTVYGDLRLIK